MVNKKIKIMNDSKSISGADKSFGHNKSSEKKRKDLASRCRKIVLDSINATRQLARRGSSVHAISTAVRSILSRDRGRPSSAVASVSINPAD